MMDTSPTLARFAATAGLPGADRRHMPDIWTDLLAVWRDHGWPQAGARAPFQPHSGHPGAPPAPFPGLETQRRT